MNSVKVVHEWTDEEKQLFDNALAELDPSSPDFYAKVAYRIPWKSIDEVKDHYHGDAEKIESHVHEMPPTLEDGQEKLQESMYPAETMGASPSPEMENVECTRRRKKSIPWTKEEHNSFLIGLDKYGKGKWKDISKNCVLTKTSAQVGSHAQKFFARQRLTTPIERRRPSINDTRSVSSTSEYDSPEVQSEFCSIGDILNNDSNLISPPQNGSQTIQNGLFISNLNYPHGFTQNHVLSFHRDFTDFGMIPTPQNDFPNVGNKVAFAHSSAAHQGGVQFLNSNQGGNFSGFTKPADSSLILPPQNVIPNIGQEISFSQPHPYHGFPQNLYSIYNLDSIGSSLISPPQSSFPGVGNESEAFANHRNLHHGGVQNLYFNQNAVQFPGVDNPIINPNLNFPSQNVIPNIRGEISFSQPHPYLGFAQNLYSMYNLYSVGSNLISPPQSSFPGVGNESSAFANHHNLHHRGVQNLYFNQTAVQSPGVDNPIINPNSNFSPQNVIPNIEGEISFFQPRPYLGFPQNLYSKYNLYSVGLTLISPPQSNFPSVGNESAAFSNHHHPDHGGVQNLYFNQNADQFPSVDNSIINPNPNFPTQNVIDPNIGGEISFSQPPLHGSTENSNPYYHQELLGLANLYDPSFLASGSSSGSANAYYPYDANYRHD